MLVKANETLGEGERVQILILDSSYHFFWEKHFIVVQTLGNGIALTKEQFLWVKCRWSNPYGSNFPHALRNRAQIGGGGKSTFGRRNFRVYWNRVQEKEKAMLLSPRRGWILSLLMRSRYWKCATTSWKCLHQLFPADLFPLPCLQTPNAAR